MKSVTKRPIRLTPFCLSVCLKVTMRTWAKHLEMSPRLTVTEMTKTVNNWSKLSVSQSKTGMYFALFYHF